MSRIKIEIIIMSGALFLAQGCAHAPEEKAVDDKVSQETYIQNRGDLAEKARMEIQNAPNLTLEQKNALMKLREKTLLKTNALAEENLKLRSVLIQDLLAAQYNEKEVEAIKVKMKDITDQRLSSIFDAVEKVKVILGDQASQSPDVMHQFFDLDHSGRSL